MNIILTSQDSNLEGGLTIKSFLKDGFLKYFQEVQKFPILTQEEEFEYGMRVVNYCDKESAKILIQSHLRLVIKIASKFKRYGLPVVDLISEGNLGLIQAVKKFDPRKGFRLSTYAMWWIRAFIQEYILKSWSLVKIGTTIAQKKLFFNLHKIKRKLGISSEVLQEDHISQIASDLNVSKKEVADMGSRLFQSDISLNSPIGYDEDSLEMADVIVDESPTQEEKAIKNQENSRRKKFFREALKSLNDREKDILFKRRIFENSLTLEELSKHYGISRERIRQIEENSIKKIKNYIFNNNPLSQSNKSIKK